VNTRSWRPSAARSEGPLACAGLVTGTRQVGRLSEARLRGLWRAAPRHRQRAVRVPRAGMRRHHARRRAGAAAGGRA